MDRWLAVALRKESVDRNMLITLLCGLLPLVALRKESVDRNMKLSLLTVTTSVALRKESVDRNDVIRPAIDVFLGRSPQGERG